MIDEKIYQEYTNWLLDYNDLIKKITTDSSPFSLHFRHVFEVIDFLYNKLIDDNTYNEEDHQIFVTGISYLSEQVYELDNILTEIYQNDYSELEKNAKSINLLLNMADLKNEFAEIENINQNPNYQQLVSLYDNIYHNYIKQKRAVTVELFEEFNMINEKLINNLDLDYLSINDIFLEIADELGII